VRFLHGYLAKAGPVCTSGIRYNQGLASVIRRAGHRVAVAEPVELLGVDRKDLKATFHEQLNDGTSWPFDGNRDTMHLPSGQVRQPCGALGQSASLMFDAAFTDTVAVTVQDTNLVSLRAPIIPTNHLTGCEFCKYS
jgi:hypothetical protein